jgi:photosystem II stability/assembly factor-like uncharacterized protein
MGLQSVVQRGFRFVVLAGLAATGLAGCGEEERPEQERGWVAIGPNVPSLIALTADPQSAATLYASNGRALFKSTDGTQTWQRLTQGLPPKLYVRTIAVDPRNSAAVYVGGFPIRGANLVQGFFRSVDGGMSWTSSTVFTLDSISSIAVDPLVPSTLYVGTVGTCLGCGGGVYKSTDSGATFSAVHYESAGKLYENYITALAVDARDPAVVYAGATDGLWKSANAGASWRHVGRGLRDAYVESLALDPADRNHLYVGIHPGGLYHSTNAGESFKLLHTSLDQVPISVLRIDPDDPRILYAATDRGVFRSLDGSRSWTATTLEPTEHEVLILAPGRPETLYAASRAGLFRSEDRAATRRRLDTAPIDAPDEYSTYLAVAPSAPETLYAATGEHGVFRSQDAGAHWRPSGHGLPERFGLCAFVVDPTDPRTVYLAAYLKGLFKTADGGQTWSPINEGLTSAVQDLAVDPRRPANLYAAGVGAVFQSQDGGALWRAVAADFASDAVLGLVLDPQVPDTLYASDGRTLYKSEDGAEHWRAVHRVGGSTEAGIVALAIAPGTPSRLFVSVLGLNGGRLLQSNDGGMSFSDLRLAGGGYLDRLAPDPRGSGAVYGIFADRFGHDQIVRIQDQTVSDLTGDLPEAFVVDVAVASGPQPRLFVGTEGEGIFGLGLD